MHIEINARMKWNFVESILSKDSNGYAEKKMQLELNHCIPPITVFDTIKSKHFFRVSNISYKFHDPYYRNSLFNYCWLINFAP